LGRARIWATARCASHAGLLLKAIISLSGLKPSFEAKAVQERELHRSGLDVTLVFAGGLTDGERTGAHRATPVEALGPVVWMPPRISRADVADFMRTELRDGRFRGQSVCVFS
jgi:uncharacterized protein YbjT (DUF2867 family)